MKPWLLDLTQGGVATGFGCIKLSVKGLSEYTDISISGKNEGETIALGCMTIAAPEMCRALLAIEHMSQTGEGYTPLCPECAAYDAHESGCTIDAALTKAGLPDQESRDAARRECGYE